MGKKALIYGISGQDGHYLSKLLAGKGYEVAGVSRDGMGGTYASRAYASDFAAESAGFLDPIDGFSPDEIYNLAGISSPSACEKSPQLADRVNALAPIAILEKISGMREKPRFFQASSAYMFMGSPGRVSESTLPSAADAYGRTKLKAHLEVARFRKAGLFACSGILFNHESPRRGENFVTRKISLGAAKIKLGLAQELLLGNLDARRDWGFAGDYVEAMWLMLQQKEPGDYVIATGESHTVREFCEEAFSHVGLDYEKHVKTDPALVRGVEAGLSADISGAKKRLGWKPKVDFKGLVRMMVDADLGMLEAKGR